MAKKDAKDKGSKGSKKKNAQLILRLDKEERDAFVEMCKELDTSAAREIRRFIRGFLKEHDGTEEAWSPEPPVAAAPVAEAPVVEAPVEEAPATED
ncbi:hypothetical protein [Albibacillus kandeliae]|uniref:hypothetical protein n=1 Tax=Albibacillus kandeliae TaxID=2174228 RepID=UPI001E33A37F|nr:hypothetical protein [Albibacillus kandeliae]